MAGCYYPLSVATTRRPSGAPSRRGRPPKFGRPSRVVALTLPHDVLDALRAIHSDPARAIVQLVEPALPRAKVAEPRPPAELVALPGRRALIVVDPAVFKGLEGVSTIPLSDGRAFLALDGEAGVADLELAILDRLEDASVSRAARQALLTTRASLRDWRRAAHLTFRSKSIIVVEGLPADRQPSAPLRSLRAVPGAPGQARAQGAPAGSARRKSE